MMPHSSGTSLASLLKYLGELHTAAREPPFAGLVARFLAAQGEKQLSRCVECDGAHADVIYAFFHMRGSQRQQIRAMS